MMWQIRLRSLCTKTTYVWKIGLSIIFWKKLTVFKQAYYMRVLSIIAQLEWLRVTLRYVSMTDISHMYICQSNAMRLSYQSFSSLDHLFLRISFKKVKTLGTDFFLVWLRWQSIKSSLAKYPIRWQSRTSYQSYLI